MVKNEIGMNLKVLILILCLWPSSEAQALTWSMANDLFTISYSGGVNAQGIGIPSWKIIVDRANGGNFKKILVPIENPNQLNDELRTISPTLVPLSGIDGTNGWWDYFNFMNVPEFEANKISSDSITLSISGTSPGNSYKYYRTYTFTKEGVKLTGYFVPLIYLRQLHHWGGWNIQALDTPGEKLPVRTQGSTNWSYMTTSYNDVSKPLPSGVNYPLQVEFVIQNYEKHYMHQFFDKPFDNVDDKLLFIIDPGKHIWDVMGAWSGPNANDTQHFQIRLHFIDSSKASSGINFELKSQSENSIRISPNPFNPSTSISFPNPNHKADIFIFDIKGREVKKIDNLKTNYVYWNASNLSAGIYQVIVKTQKKVFTKRVTLQK